MLSLPQDGCGSPPVATQSGDLVPSYKGWREILSVDGTKPAKVMTVYMWTPLKLYEPVMLGW